MKQELVRKSSATRGPSPRSRAFPGKSYGDLSTHWASEKLGLGFRVSLEAARTYIAVCDVMCLMMFFLSATATIPTFFARGWSIRI